MNLTQTAESALKKGISRINFENKDQVRIEEAEYKNLLDTCEKMDATITQNLIEKEIAKEMPKDFDDVFIVAKSMLNPHPNATEIRRTVREIKAKYPNLFIDMNEYFKNVMDFDD